MFRRFVYARTLSALCQTPHHILVELGLDTREAREKRAHDVAYG